LHSQVPIFLDRDGVLLELVQDGAGLRAARSLDEYQLIRNVDKAIDGLHDNFLLIVITNQPDIAKNKVSLDMVNQINNKLMRDIPRISEILVCPHSEDDKCNCRKPKPGLIFEFFARYNYITEPGWMIGDRWVDIEAGINAKLRTILIKKHYSWDRTTSGVPSNDTIPNLICSSLNESLKLISRTFI
jgi:D-glycero-D-manno-heptose 1,7-bisphosphate phosphatase